MGGSRSDDFDRVRDALQIAKSENRKLRKQVAQLQKELQRSREHSFDVSLELEEELLPAREKTLEKQQLLCPKCKSKEFQRIPAGKYTISHCKDCSYRKRTENKV